MSTTDHWDVIAMERLVLADDLDTLEPAQWEVPSLCGEWTVRQLVGHLVATHTTSVWTFAREVVRARGSLGKANHAVGVREGERSVADLVSHFRRLAGSHFTPPGFGWQAPLTDVLVHSLDIRVPLGLPIARPAEHYRPALDLLMTSRARIGFVPKRLPRLRFLATDIDWARGSGDEVRATGADIALVLTGRKARIAAIEGPGRDALAAWLGV